MKKAKWRLYLDFFTKVLSKEDIFGTYLEDASSLKGYNGQENANRWETSNQSKGLLIVNAILSCKTFAIKQVNGFNLATESPLIYGYVV